MQDNTHTILGVIPARLGSTRIPEKMLKDIEGKKLIERTIERTQKCTSLDQLIVTTDSEHIADLAKAYGVEVVMTDSAIPTGTDRVAAAVAKFTECTPDIVVNIWGDEPLYPATAIDDCVQLLIDDPDLHVATVADKITDLDMVDAPSIVQVLTDLNNNVLCFSRCPVPYPHTGEDYDHYHVIGVMAMRTGFLKEFIHFPRTPIEMREGVEQMRILEHGYRIRTVKGDFKNLGVNTPEELEIVREIYKSEGGT